MEGSESALLDREAIKYNRLAIILDETINNIQSTKLTHSHNNKIHKRTFVTSTRQPDKTEVIAVAKETTFVPPIWTFSGCVVHSEDSCFSDSAPFLPSDGMRRFFCHFLCLIMCISVNYF